MFCLLVIPSYPKVTEYMNEHKIAPVGCIELYPYGPEDIQYIMYFDHKEIFDELQESSFVAANEL